MKMLIHSYESRLIKTFLRVLTFSLLISCFNTHPLYALATLELEGAYSANWSPDGSLMAIGGTNGLWLYHPFTNNLEFLTNEFSFQSWTLDNRIFTGFGFYNPITRHMEGKFELQPPPDIFSPAIGLSRDAKSFALLEGDYLDTIVVYNTDNGTLIRRIETHNQNAGPQIAWSPDDSQFAMLTPNRPSVLIIPNTGEPKITEYSLHLSPNYKPDQWPSRVKWSPNGKLLAIFAGSPSTIFLLDVQNGIFVDHLEGQVADTLMWSPDGALLAVSNGLDTVSVFDVRTGRVIEQYPSIHGKRQYRYFMEFSPYGGQLAITNDVGGNEAQIQSTAYFRSIGKSNAVQLFVPAPSLERLKSITQVCGLQPNIQDALNDQIDENNLQAFTDQISALTEAQIPLGCKADVLAVARILTKKAKS